MRRAVLLGVDAGGTRTRAILADASGQVLGKGDGGPANILVREESAVLQSLREAVEAALRQASLQKHDVQAAVFGVAGCNRPADLLFLHRLIRPLVSRGRLRVFNDAVIAWAGATGGQPGIVVIAGTGSIAYGVNERGEEYRAGGWSPPFGDEGSGYDLGLRAIRAVMWAYDGRGPVTALTGAVSAHLGLRDVPDLWGVLYRPLIPQSRVAGLAPVVFGVAESGDRVARDIVRQAAGDLAMTAGAVLRRLHLFRGPVFLGGGLWQGPLFTQAFREALSRKWPGVSPLRPRETAEWGALRLAWRELGQRAESFPQQW